MSVTTYHAVARMTPLLADDFFLLAHDDVSGKARLPARTVGLGLAGALLGELVLFGNIEVHTGAVVVVDRRPPADALAHRVLDHLLAEQDSHSVHTWLAFLAASAAGNVAERLARFGLVTFQESRLPWRSSRWVPADMTVAAIPAVRLRTYLLRSEPLAVPDVVLAGLVAATGLTPTVLWDLPAVTHRYLDYAMSQLPDSLHAVISETSAAVGNAIASHRI